MAYMCDYFNIKENEFTRYISNEQPELKPNGYNRCFKIKSGDEIYIKNNGNHPKLGDKYKNYDAVITRLDYKPKKWWQFWKKKELLGYVVRWK